MDKLTAYRDIPVGLSITGYPKIKRLGLYKATKPFNGKRYYLLFIGDSNERTWLTDIQADNWKRSK